MGREQQSNSMFLGHAPHFILLVPSCRVLFLQAMILEHSLSGWHCGISDAVGTCHKQRKQISSKAQKDECHVHKYVENMNQMSVEI
jgi:hypothetical protein